MQQCQVSIDLNNTDFSIALGVEVWLDQALLYNTEHLNQSHTVTHQFDDSEAEHELKIVLKNKTAAHTQLDDQGNIVKDARIVVGAVRFDQIDLDQILIDQAVYTHNCNGTSDPIQEKFYGEMGCNGMVSLRFTTPMYVWLLENM